MWHASEVVATTLASADGDPKASVAPMRTQASSSIVAVSSAGLVTSHAGRHVGMPSAGPYSANGANAATRRSSAVMP